MILRHRSGIAFLATGIAAASALLAASPRASAYQSVIASPNWFDFGPQRVGTMSGLEVVNVQNTGDEDINFLNAIPLGDTMAFQVTNMCSYLPRYGSCSIWLRFEPRREGRYSIDIQIQGVGAFATVSAYGEGVKRD